MRERLRPAHVVWAMTTLFVVVSTAAPFHFDTSLQSVSAHFLRIRLNPLVAPDTGGRVSIPDFVQNVLLFVPFGAAAVLALVGSTRGSITSAVFLGCALSVSMESIQLLTTHRISSSADVLANTIGTLMGATAAVMSRRRGDYIRVARLRLVAAPTYYPTVATALLVCIASWEPFDITLDVGVVWGHLKTLRASLWQTSFSGDHIIMIVLFLLFGFMLAQCLRELRVRFPVTVGIAATMTAGIALEASQVFIQSRLPTVADALANAAGGVAGGLVSALGADVRSTLRVLSLACLLAAGVATTQWISGHEGGFSAIRDVGLCLVGAYVGVWSAARTFAQSTD